MVLALVACKAQPTTIGPGWRAARTVTIGLAFLVRLRRILRFGEITATIELPRGGETVYRRANAGAVVAWGLLVTS
jgi:hypothetical protein